MAPKKPFPVLFRELSVKFARFYTVVLGEENVTLPQFSVLAQVKTYRSLCMHEVAAQLHISRSAVTQIVERMVRKKWLLRTDDLHDRRVKHVELTALGLRLVDRIQVRTVRFITKQVNAFSKHEQSTIRLFYETLSVALEKELS